MIFYFLDTHYGVRFSATVRRPLLGEWREKPVEEKLRESKCP